MTSSSNGKFSTSNGKVSSSNGKVSTSNGKVSTSNGKVSSSNHKVWSVLKDSKITKQDVYFTPPESLESITRYITRFNTIWEPACGELHISKYLEEKGHSVISTDIAADTRDGDCKDFFLWKPEKLFDLIFTNPPFSLKYGFLERCYELGKPFILLMPLPCIGYIKISRLLKKHGYLQVFIPPRKIKFISVEGRTDNPYFSSAFFAWKLDDIEENRIVFID